MVKLTRRNVVRKAKCLPDDRFTIANGDEVDRLLSSEPELRGVVQDAADELATRFQDVRFCLDVIVDPEYGTDRQLFLGVASDGGPDETIETLRRFDREWWTHNVRRSRGLLVIDLCDE